MKREILFTTTPYGISWMVLALLFLLMQAAPVAARAQSPGTPAGQTRPVKVLYVNSYHPGYSWSDQISAGINETLTNALGPDLDLRVEYLDAKRFDRELEDGLGDEILALWARKYARSRFDLLLVSDQSAYNLMRRARTPIFPGVPLIFAGVEEPGGLDAATTGILASSDLKGNLELILKVLPATQRIWVVSDSSVTGRFNRTRIARIAAESGGRFRLEFFDAGGGLEPQMLLARAAQVSAPDVIFFMDYYTAPSGAVNTMDSLRQLTEAARVPVFSHVDLYLDCGVVGGKMNSGLLQGRQMAELGLKVLQGQAIDGFEPQLEESLPTFDYAALCHYGIDPQRLPPGSRIIGRPDDWYQKYRRYLLGGMLFMLGETALVVLLLLLLRRQRLLRRQARAAAARFEALFDLSPFSIVINDIEGRYLMVNRSFCETAGQPREEIIGRTMSDLGRQIDQEYSRRMVDELRLKGSLSGQEMVIASRGGQRHILFAAQLIELDGKEAVLSATIDITDRKKAEEALRNSEENLRITLDSIGDAVIATDTAGCVTRMNPVAERLTGWPVREALGKPLSDVFRIVNAQSRDPVANPVANVLVSGQVVGLANHTLLLSRDGHEYQVADSGAPIFSDAGEIVGVVLVFRDMTEEHALQEQLAQSQKMDAIGQLAGGVAHDFNNMLGGIIGAAELLQEDLAPDDPGSGYIEMILNSAQRAADLTRKLLTFARRQPVGSTPVDVHRAVRDTLAILEKTIDKRIRLEHDLGAAASMVVGDAAQLQSVFLNLGINASHAMPAGGRLVFRSRVVFLSGDDCDHINFDLQPGSHIEIQVCDTGSGITPENLSRIFEPFFTTKEQGKGTGLGLAAAYGTVVQHMGAITVDSEVGRGTCFKILLPLAEAAVGENAVIEAPVHGRGLVLLVDDEEIIRITGKRMLEQYGYDVLLAGDGRAALDLFREHMDRIDLVIVDMIMPEMNGRDCFSGLQELCPDVRVLLSSGFLNEDDLHDLRQRGLAGFIHKPFRGVEFSRMVAAALKSQI